MDDYGDDCWGEVAELKEQVVALRAQLAAVPVEAIRTVCEPGGYPTVRWFDAQSVVNAWLADLRGEAQP